MEQRAGGFCKGGCWVLDCISKVVVITASCRQLCPPRMPARCSKTMSSAIMDKASLRCMMDNKTCFPLFCRTHFTGTINISYQGNNKLESFFHYFIYLKSCQIIHYWMSSSLVEHSAKIIIGKSIHQSFSSSRLPQTSCHHWNTHWTWQHFNYQKKQ